MHTHHAYRTGTRVPPSRDTAERDRTAPDNYTVRENTDAKKT